MCLSFKAANHRSVITFFSLMTRISIAFGMFVIALLFSCFASAQSDSTIRSLKEIREQGVVMQKWDNSCAAASIATVLTYGFNDPVTERFAAEKMLGQTEPKKVRAQGGFSLLDLKNFVESRGFIGNAYKNLSVDDLSVFHAPIVPINIKGYNHYVVFNGVAIDHVHLADPAFGNRRLPIADFENIWINGMAFVVTRKDN